MNEKVSEFLRKPWVIPTGVGVVAYGAGIGTVVLWAQYQYNKNKAAIDAVTAEYEEKLSAIGPDILGTEEEGEVEAPPSIVTTPRRDPSGITVDEESQELLDELITEYGTGVGYKMYHEQTEEPEPEPEEEVIVNVFANDEEWDQDREDFIRTHSDIYIINKDEFWEEDEVKQVTLTYYKGDDILVDEGSVPIGSYEKVIGEHNLKFGYGSGDKNVVYIYNTKLKVQYEVLLDNSTYALEVLGLEAEEEQERELRHSAKKPGRFRTDD